MLMKQQRTFQQQQKCLHVITCLLFSCLLLLIEWQAVLATPILTKSITSTAITSSKTAARQGVGGVSGIGTRRLREHTKPSRENKRRGHARGGGGGGASSSPCEHKSLGELIKTSPVILKALGAHIFNHDDDEDLRILHNSNDALLLKWQNEQNKVLTSLKRTEQLQQKFPYSTSSSSSFPSLSLSARKSAEKTRQLQNKQTLSSSRAQSSQQQQTFSDAATNRAAMLASMNADAILITLTPETIYKGASLLKMTPNAAEHGTSRTASSSSGGGGSSSTSTNSFGNSNANSDGSGGSAGAGLNAGTINSSEASYLYEGQLNATVQPLSCFDDNLLKLLPSDLIIFGKLITIDEQQQQQQQQLHQTQQQRNDFLIDLNDYVSSSAQAHHHQQQPSTKEVLKISINGLHRWSSQFENYIWKHLGWDDWSDFTVCSVACGKGVQQRFRRCLLDNPMVNLNMNFNNDADDDDDDDDEEDDIGVDMDVDADVIVEMELEEDLVEDDGGDDNSDSIMVDDVDVDVGVGVESEQHKTSDDKHNKAQNFATSTATTTTFAGDVNHQNYSEKSDILITGNMLHFVTTPRTKITVETTMKTEEEPEVMRIFEGHFNDTFPSTLEATARDTLTINNGKSIKGPLSSSSASASALPLKDKVNSTKSKKLKLQQQQQQQQQQKRKTKHRKHKSAKFYSTMFCEGYNIEQRNCNSFECSDDINDLLKFYRKYPTTDEANTASSTQTMMTDFSNTMAAAAAAASSSVPTIAGPSSSSTTNSEIDGTALNNENLNTFTTPINMGYVLNWHNILNFTIMLTLRVKNDSYTTATIFSIRNSTHNLYLESCKDGLRLYLERDKTTEMLPIKFNLYDYHWHQVAISIQNGDFISIHVDCFWTNSFVVSKRLFSLPLAADVEIGRGFNGELQQLLILPEHQERYQCSEKRTSINEVKRYIIDTFIDDYAN